MLSQVLEFIPDCSVLKFDDTLDSGCLSSIQVLIDDLVIGLLSRIGGNSPLEIIVAEDGTTKGLLRRPSLGDDEWDRLSHGEKNGSSATGLLHGIANISDTKSSVIVDKNSCSSGTLSVGQGNKTNCDLGANDGVMVIDGAKVRKVEWLVSGRSNVRIKQPVTAEAVTTEHTKCARDRGEGDVLLSETQTLRKANTKVNSSEIAGNITKTGLLRKRTLPLFRLPARSLRGSSLDSGLHFF